MHPRETESTKAIEPELSPYRAFMDVREQILRYKWIASEKAGHDIGFEPALLGWTNDNQPGKDP